MKMTPWKEKDDWGVVFGWPDEVALNLMNKVSLFFKVTPNIFIDIPLHRSERRSVYCRSTKHNRSISISVVIEKR